MPGAHVVYTTTPPSQRFDQLTVLALTPAGTEPATTTTLDVTGGDAVAVDWRGGRDVLVRRLALSDAVKGVVATDATMAKYTKDAGDTVLRNGTRLRGEGRKYVSVKGSAATVTVSARTVRARGDATNRYRVFAPQDIRRVVVNGVRTSVCRDGEYLEFPCL